MTTLDDVSLFNNITFNESIDICIHKLFQDLETLINGITKNDFRGLLNLNTKK